MSKFTMTWDGEKHDLIPVRLPHKRKAYLLIPRQFDAEDVERITEWLRLQVTTRLLPAPECLEEKEAEE